MQEIFRNKSLNYGYIISLTLLVLILVFNIFQGNFTKFTGSIKLSTKNIKLILLLILLVTYISLVTPSVRMIIQSTLILKTPPRGDRGHRGSRGIIGKSAACSECGDDLCYKKMLYNITNTINFWKQENATINVNVTTDFLADNYVIPNEYIKDKIKKHCGSKEFKELLSKYGSNNNNISDGNSFVTKPSGLTEVQCPVGVTGGCGAYDYMFKIWSIWILIILRYKNGLFFLESEGLNENDFEGLIDNEDKGGTQTWDNMFDIKKLSSIKKTSKDGQVTYEFKNIESNGDETDGIQQAFITKIGNVPGGGANGPFEEIKKYRAWRWGSDNALKPKFTIVNEPKNKICDSCWNSSMCIQNKNTNTNTNTNTGGLKFKFSNSYKKLINTEIFDNSITENNYLKPFQPLSSSQVSNSQGGENTKVNFGLTDNDHITLFRPQVLIDDSDEPYFREYKPLGDVILKNSEYTNTQVEEKTCAPNDPKNKFYDEEVFTTVLGKKDGGKYDKVPSRTSPASNSASAPHIYTLLVSGDTQPPISYDLIGSTINKTLSTTDTDSDDTPLESITVWKPIAPNNYVACGYVIDKRPYKGSDKSNAPQPPLDLVATIPKASLGEYPFNQFKFAENGEIGSFSRSNLNLFKRKTGDDDTGFAGAGGTGGSCTTSDGTNCYTCVTKPSTVGLDLSSGVEVLGTVKKNKKYSILKIYE